MPEVVESVAGSPAVFRTVLANRDLRRVVYAFAGFNMAEWATWVAILVFAFGRGGATEVGVVAVAQLVPAAIAAPVASVLGDRYRRDRVLLVGYLAQAAAMAAAAAALLGKAPVPLVYTFAALTTTTFTVTRPVQGALLPSLARTPVELIAANVAGGTVESASFLAGPAVAGVILGLSQPGMVFVAMAALVMLSAASVARLSVPETREHTHEFSLRAMAHDTGEGFRTLATESRPRLVVGLLAAQSVVLGALDVLMVALALGVLKLSTAWPAYFDAALGAGGVIGSLAGLLLVGRRRLSIPLALGVIILGLPVAALGLAPAAALGLALFVVAGAGRVLMEISGRTLLQRIVSDQFLARIFGILEGLYTAGLAAGAALATALVALFGVPGGLVAAGAVLPILALAAWRKLAHIDAEALVPARELEILRGEGMFAPLPAPVIERLAGALVPVLVSAGADVMRQGEPGDRFYILDQGEADVFIDGALVRRLYPRASFGEIALLRDVPRTATVSAVTDCRLIGLDRAVFLEAVTGNPTSHAAARAVVEGRMSGSSTPSRSKPRPRR